MVPVPQQTGDQRRLSDESSAVADSGHKKTQLRGSVHSSSPSTRPRNSVASLFSADLEARTLEQRRESFQEIILCAGRSSDDDAEERATLHSKAVIRRSSGKDVGDLVVLYFPDPPCILPCRSGLDSDKDATGTDAAAPEYWKQHATWMDTWPILGRRRIAAKEFVDRWMDLYSEDAENSARAFVNVHEKPVAVRAQPVSSSEMKTGKVVYPGDMVIATEVVERDGVKYLKLDGGAGWLFETQAGEQVMAKMARVAVGSWWFRAASGESVRVRKTPLNGDTVPSDWVLSPKEIVLVDVKARVNGCAVVHLADGRGWLPELRLPELCRGSAHRSSWECQETSEDRWGQREEEEKALALVKEIDFEVAARSGGYYDYSSMVPPTNKVVEVGEWTYAVGVSSVLAIGLRQFGTLLNPGERVKVDKRSIANGEAPPSIGRRTSVDRRWLRLQDCRGWVPETDMYGQELLTLQGPGSFPGWSAGKSKADAPEDDWMVGFV